MNVFNKNGECVYASRYEKDCYDFIEKYDPGKTFLRAKNGPWVPVDEEAYLSLRRRVSRKVKPERKHKVESLGGTESKIELNFEVCAKTLKRVWLVGPKGCGKTHAALDFAKRNEKEIGLVSCSDGMLPSDIFGPRAIKNGDTQWTKSPFALALQNGGVAILDEVDAAPSGVLIALNSLLANGVTTIYGEELKLHPEAVLFATSNTHPVRYVAQNDYLRNRIDAAFSDRFACCIFVLTYSETFERANASPEVYSFVCDLRESGKVVSTRALLHAEELRKVKQNWKERILESV